MFSLHVNSTLVYNATAENGAPFLGTKHSHSVAPILFTTLDKAKAFCSLYGDVEWERRASSHVGSCNVAVGEVFRFSIDPDDTIVDPEQKVDFGFVKPY